MSIVHSPWKNAASLAMSECARASTRIAEMAIDLTDRINFALGEQFSGVNIYSVDKEGVEPIEHKDKHLIYPIKGHT